MATTVNVAVTVAVAVAAFGLRIPSERWAILAGVGILVALGSAGLGLAVGTWLKDYRTVQPLLGVALAGSFFASGGYASVATLPEPVRALNMYWPPAYVFETMQWLMNDPSASVRASVWLGLAIAAASGLVLASLAQRRAHRPATG